MRDIRIGGYSFAMPIRSEVKLHLFVYLAFGINIPTIKVCPDHSAPFDAFADAYFSRATVSLWKASRGFGGKSFLEALLASTWALTQGAQVKILGGSGVQSRRIIEAMEKINTFKGIPPGSVIQRTNSLTEYPISGGSVEALMASRRSVRGPHPQKLILDEVDEMDLLLLNDALGQPMSANGIYPGVVAASTHQNAQGTMTEMIKRVRLNKDKGWKWHEWCFRETMKSEDVPWGWLSQRDVEDARSRVPLEMWRTEYEGQEPNPGSRAFTPATVERMFQIAQGHWVGQNAEYIEVEAPVPGARYAHGADWGKEKDRTCIATLRMDVLPYRTVAFEAMRRIEFPLMVERLRLRMKKYGGKGCHDQTGIGNPIDGFARIPSLEGVVLVGHERKDILTEYITLVERGEIVAPMIDLCYDEHKYCSMVDMFGGIDQETGQKGHLPDTVCAMALAYRAGKKKRPAWTSA